MRTTLKDIAVEIYVLFFLKEKKLSYQEKKIIAKKKAIEYVEHKICSFQSSAKRHEHIEDYDWDIIKKYLETL